METRPPSKQRVVLPAGKENGYTTAGSDPGSKKNTAKMGRNRKNPRKSRQGGGGGGDGGGRQAKSGVLDNVDANVASRRAEQASALHEKVKEAGESTKMDDGHENSTPTFAQVVKDGSAVHEKTEASEPHTTSHATTFADVVKDGSGALESSNGKFDSYTPAPIQESKPAGNIETEDVKTAESKQADFPTIKDTTNTGKVDDAVNKQSVNKQTVNKQTAKGQTDGASDEAKTEAKSSHPAEKSSASTQNGTKTRSPERKRDGSERSTSSKQEVERDNQELRNGIQAGGIRFAPLDVPLKRRMQTLAVFAHSLSIATLVSIFFFLCAIPITWPILIPYLIHVLVSNAASDGKLRYRSDRFRSLAIWKLFAGYFPAQLHKTADLAPTRKYIFGYHPHGIISHGAWAAFATDALAFSQKFPGITNSLLTLDSNFRIPFYRDYVLAMGLQSVSKESIGNILTRGGPNGEGMGRAVTIVVGGARESLEAQPGTLRLVLRERKGFIKLAVRTGADLVPVLAFGENDLYDQVSPQTHPILHAIQMFVLRVWKFTLPFLHGRGIFNYDVGLMPYRHPLNIVVGKPIKVVQSTTVDPAQVDRLHDLYVQELERIWDQYKDVFAKNRKEDFRILK